jgi:hypothetical protein
MILLLDIESLIERKSTDLKLAEYLKNNPIPETINIENTILPYKDRLKMENKPIDASVFKRKIKEHFKQHIPFNLTKIAFLNFSDNQITKQQIIEYSEQIISDIFGPFVSIHAINDRKSLAKDSIAELGEIQNRVFNRKDLINKSGMYDLGKLNRFIDDEDSFFLSRYLTENLIQLLKLFPTIIGYRRSGFCIESNYINKSYHPISDIEKYLDHYLSLKKISKSYKDNTTDKTIYNFVENPGFITEVFKRNVVEDISRSHVLGYIFEAYENCVMGIRKRIYLEGGDSFISRNFIDDLKTKIGTIYIGDCTEGEYCINEESNSLAFINIDKLDNSSLLNLFLELNKEKFYDKRIILQSNNYLLEPERYSFYKVGIPSVESCKDYMYLFFWFLAKTKGLFLFPVFYEYPDSRNSIDKQDLNYCKVMNDALFNIPSLRELENIIDFLKSIPNIYPLQINSDFIFDLQEYITQKYKTVTIKEQSYTGKDSNDYSLVFIHVENKKTKKDTWKIIDQKNNVECNVNYLDSIVLLSIVYLFLYTDKYSANKINTDYLYKEISFYKGSPISKIPDKGSKHYLDNYYARYFDRIKHPYNYEQVPLKEEKQNLLKMKKVLFDITTNHIRITSQDTFVIDRSKIMITVKDKSLDDFIKSRQL